jgi:nucleotide-binding universal stress UspA family protein
MEHILVPIDFSPESEQTLIIASNEARLKNAKVTLLHVLESVTPQDLELYPAIITDDNSTRETEAKEKLEAIRKKYFSSSTVDVIVKRCFGSVYAEIVSVEADVPVSLIVLSAHSRTLFEKLFLENTSSKVIGASKCPVLVVPV